MNNITGTIPCRAPFKIPARAIIMLLVYAVLLIALFRDALLKLFYLWEKADYNYCYVIPFVVAWLIWEKRAELANLPSRYDWRGYVPLALGFVLYWGGALGRVPYVLFISLWLLVTGIAWTHLGWRKINSIRFAVLFSLTMFPIPGVLYNAATLKLKLVSSRLAVSFIHSIGLPAFQEGSIIDIGFSQLQVVDACSGIRSLVSLVVMGILVAYYSGTNAWKRSIIVFSALPIAIVLNACRIALTAWIHSRWGARFAEGFFHMYSGWLIFVVAMVLMLTIAYCLHKIPWGRSRAAVPVPHPEKKSPPCAPETLQYNPPASLFHAMPRFIGAISLLAAMLAITLSVDFREKIPLRTPLTNFPLKMGRWDGHPAQLGEEFIDALQFSDYALIDYLDSKGNLVNLYIAYYDSQSKWSTIHSPSTCLTGGGWVFDEAGEARIPLSQREASFLTVQRAVIQKGGDKLVAYYWFPQRGRNLSNPWQMRFYTFWDALTKQRTDGALVRLVTPLDETEPVGTADDRLVEFTEMTHRILWRHLPD